MRFSCIRVANIFSFDDVAFPFEDFSVIVGPNASGKTNFVRILQFLTRANEKSIFKIALPTRFRLDPNKVSSVILEVLLSGKELRMIIGLLTNRQIAEPNPDTAWLAHIVLHWETTPDDEKEVSLIFVHFS